jgi:hypothetical protein
MGLWDGLKDAQVFEKGNFFGVGVFDLEVGRCLTKQTIKSGLGFIVEFDVLTSTNPAHKTGSKGTWFQKMENQMVAFSAIKEFIIALHGFDPKLDAARIEQDLAPHISALMDHGTGPANGFAGKRIRLETFMTKTKSRGTDFTVHRWSPYYEDGSVVVPEPVAVAAPPQAYAPAPQYVAPPPQAYPPQVARPVANQAHYAPPQQVAVGAPPQPVWNPALGRYVLP